MSPARKAFWAVLLTFVAGWVNTGGYIWTARVLTGNMSGDTIESALYALTGHANIAWMHATALLLFLGGLLACRFLHDALARRKWKSTACVTLLLELALVLTATALLLRDAAGLPLAIIACLAFALGLQNATLTRVGILSLRTTHVTGTISHFAEAFADYVFWVRDEWRTARVPFHQLPRDSWHNEHFQVSLVTFAVWVAFFLGAVCFLLAQTRLGYFALLPPMGLLLCAIISDVISPMQRSGQQPAPLV
ncbi:MAG: YoaK family protein [Acidobacteriaceae bacterium]